MIDTRYLFQELTSLFISDMEKVPFTDWKTRTCYPTWTVKDIIAHLIQTSLGRLSKQRDHYPNKTQPERMEFRKLAGLIDSSNHLWIQVFKGISPEIMFELFKYSEKALADFIHHQELKSPAFYPVAWADESLNQNWLDIGREYTERWSHQQQIREALKIPLSKPSRFMKPVLDILIQALPYWYRPLPADEGIAIHIEILGESGGDRFLVKEQNSWKITKSTARSLIDKISLSEDVFWKFMMRNITPDDVVEKIHFSSDSNYCKQFLQCKAVMVND